MKIYGFATVPLEAQYVFRQGLEMMDYHREEAALVFLRQAVCIAPGFSKAYREMGTCLSRLGREDEASFCWKKSSQGTFGQMIPCGNPGSSRREPEVSLFRDPATPLPP